MTFFSDCLRDGDVHTTKKKAASGGELPEAAVAAVRSRDAGGGGASQALRDQGTDNELTRTDYKPTNTTD
jgi:hypothetical protein